MLKKSLLSTSILIAIGCLKASEVTAPLPQNAKPPMLKPGFPTNASQVTTYEKCFGVNRQDGNACAYASFDGLPSECAGSAKACDPAAWVWVPQGMCTSIVVGSDAKGNILRGTLEPTMSRGKPVQCTPYDAAVIAENTYGM